MRGTLLLAILNIQSSYARNVEEPDIEVAAGRFAFWKPDDARYWTQSTPE